MLRAAPDVGGTVERLSQELCRPFAAFLVAPSATPAPAQVGAERGGGVGSRALQGSCLIQHAGVPPLGLHGLAGVLPCWQPLACLALGQRSCSNGP